MSTVHEQILTHLSSLRSLKEKQLQYHDIPEEAVDLQSSIDVHTGTLRTLFDTPEASDEDKGLISSALSTDKGNGTFAYGTS